MRSLLIVFVLALAPSAAAQHDGHHHAASPYADETGRAIKALSADDQAGLLEGRGMGLARAAELNGYPGPLHALELADALGLSPEQRAATEAIRAAMLADAQAVGAQIVEVEGHLDALFAGGRATDALVDRMTGHLGTLQGRLRAAHLRAHVALVDVLTLEQREAYDRLRGYTSE